MATLYNNGSGNQSMGNMGAGMAAAQAEWQKAMKEHAGLEEDFEHLKTEIPVCS